jgi:two-component system, cell cycle sensor histidine kinase and response regulator CckA
MEPTSFKPFLADLLSPSAAEAFLDSIIENIPDMIFVKEAEDLRFVRFNRAGEELLGYKRESLIGKNDYDFFPKEEANFFVSRDRAVLASGQVLDIPEEPIHTRYKGKRYLHTKKIPIFAADGTPRFLLGISEDITDRKKMEQTEAELYRSRNIEALGRLAGGVAHDFNNLITGILGVTVGLKESADTTPAQQQELDEILKAGERAAALTRQLLAFGRRQISAARPLLVNDVIRGIQPLLRRLIGADVDIQYDLSPQLGPCRLDPGQLEQVILNLVLNARDAMPTGGRVRIVTCMRSLSTEDLVQHPELKSGEYINIIVADNGQGMDAETCAHAFEPFYTTKPKAKGTGLGLATTYGIIKQNGGEIRLESTLGHGTTVRILLPRVDEQIQTELRRLAIDGHGHETILVVEDEDLVRRTVVNALTKAGYHVLQAADGQESIAISAAYADKIDLLLTDVVMPGINGRQLATQMRASRPDLKILFMSGYTQDLILSRDLVRPGVAFLEKAFTAEVLLDKVRRVLNQPIAIE